MGQASSEVSQAIFPLLISSLVWIGSIILRNHLLEERLKATTSLEVEVRARLEILTLVFSFVSGLSLAVLIGLSIIGLGYATGYSWPSIRVLFVSFLACSLLSFKSLPLGTGSALADSLLLGLTEVGVGISSMWGLDHINAHPGFLPEGAFLWLLGVGSCLGLIIRILVYYLRRL